MSIAHDIGTAETWPPAETTSPTHHLSRLVAHAAQLCRVASDAIGALAVESLTWSKHTRIVSLRQDVASARRHAARPLRRASEALFAVDEEAWRLGIERDYLERLRADPATGLRGHECAALDGERTHEAIDEAGLGARSMRWRETAERLAAWGEELSR